MFKKLEEWLNILSTVMGDIKKTQIELLEVTTIISEMKITVKGINDRLDIAEERISELEDL